LQLYGVGFVELIALSIKFRRRKPMNQSPLFYRTAIAIAVFFVSAFAAQAQQAPAFGPNYDVVLQVIVGSNDAQDSELPKELASVSKKLRSHFNFSGYRLANTFLGRVGENGNLEYKSVANILNKESAGETPTFLDWTIARFGGTPESGAKTEYHAETFRFGARVPVRMGARPEMPVSYENIGLNLNRLGFLANTPTLLGTISLPQASGTMFLVITVKQATF
jgi:hypothetical protein